MDDDIITLSKPVVNVSDYEENEDLIKCNISMFSEEPTSVEEKIFLTNKNNNYNLSMFSDD